VKSVRRLPKSLQPLLLASMVLSGVFGVATGAAAQELKDVQTAKTPLVLKARGSFFVGGETVNQTAIEVGIFGDDKVTVNQMYVEYMVPQGATKVPVVMIHGSTLSGKTYDTTPDGRMGWYEYFVRQGHPVYVPDQVGRARSGFNQAIFNDVRAGLIPPNQQPNITRLADNLGAWVNLRFGPTPGVPYPGELFPVEAAAEFSKQDIPDLNSALNPLTNPSFKAESDLARKAGGAVLMGHSQGARQPTPAALVNPSGVLGLIIIEPSNCTHPTGPTLTDQQIATLATIPILVMFGDNLSPYPGVGNNWQTSFDDCNAFVARVKAAGGNAQMIWPPDLGIHGNSHMIMQDKNNLQIADLILKWIDENVSQKKSAKK